MKRQGLVALGASICLVISSLFAADAPKLDGVKCPIAGDDEVDTKVSLNFNGGKIYFCCNDCLKSFKEEKDKGKQEKNAANANQQLFVTGQAKQIKCPMEGKPVSESNTVEIGGKKIGFCCEECREKVAGSKQAEQVELVFGTKPFAKGFKVDAKDKTARARDKGPREITEKEVRRLIEVQERNTEKLLAIKGVVGTAVGAGEKGDPVIKVLVETKEAARDVPANVEGVPVEVEVTGPIKPIREAAPRAKSKPPAINRTSRFPRPVPTGISTGNAGECSAGTIGCRVKKNGSVYMLSNNHVLARQNNAPKDSPILQPGPYDTQCAVNTNDQIGTLAEFKQIFFGGVDNEIDAALGLSSTSNLGNGTPSDGYGIPKSVTAAAAINQNVQKYGRTTGLTKGRVSAINAIVNVGYSGGTARFVNQIVVKPQNGSGFIKSGDSGSLLVNDPGKNPVGLLFAGNSTGSVAIANPIGKVLSEFSVTIDGE